VGGIISFWWAASFRYDGRHHLVSMGGFVGIGILTANVASWQASGRYLRHRPRLRRNGRFLTVRGSGQGNWISSSRCPSESRNLKATTPRGSASGSFREIVVTTQCRTLHLENQRRLDVAQGLARLHGARVRATSELARRVPSALGYRPTGPSLRGIAWRKR
jgi:hypothetical protein